MTQVHIIPFKEAHAADFKRLNLAWLEGNHLLEPADLKHLDAPGHMIQNGGRILVAQENGRTVGCCAVIVKDTGTAELAKFAVDQDSRGRGIGRRLALESIALARQMGCGRIILVSNSKLTPAIRLYESLGFEHRPLPDGVEYETADVYMELHLG